MADSDGRAANTLKHYFTDTAYKFDFFHAVWMLEHLFEDHKQVGFDGPACRESIRFMQEASFTFPASSIAAIEFADIEAEADHKPISMYVNFFGLYGRHGILPWHYTQRLVDQQKKKSGSMRFFLDMFNHRLISLFYRSGTKYSIPRRLCSKDSEQLQRNFCGLIGLATRHMQDKLLVPDVSLLKYATLYNQPHSAVSLQTLLRDYFAIPVAIRQFIGQWYALESQNHNTIALQKEQSKNNTLGRSFSIGKRIWSIQHKFRIVIGPVDFETFCTLLPHKDLFPKIVQLVRMFVGMSLDFDIEIRTLDTAVPGMVLGRQGNALQIGCNTWLTRKNSNGKMLSQVFSVRG